MTAVLAQPYVAESAPVVAAPAVTSRPLSLPAQTKPVVKPAPKPAAKSTKLKSLEQMAYLNFAHPTTHECVELLAVHNTSAHYYVLITREVAVEGCDEALSVANTADSDKIKCFKSLDDMLDAIESTADDLVDEGYYDDRLGFESLYTYADRDAAVDVADRPVCVGEISFDDDDVASFVPMASKQHFED